MDPDLVLALKLQEQFNKEGEPKETTALSKIRSDKASLVDPDWELTDPNPNIYDLFQIFNSKYFWDQLGSVEVKWSPRMTTCAGICTYKGRAGCIVSLSLPLLRLRPRRDLIETLLHEMIHAYLFVTKNNRDRTGHGPEFHKHMHRINNDAGTKISVYHTFHDEVKHYKTHWWCCNGPCKGRPPFYGLVKRAMNRAPGKQDFWFEAHQQNCGGQFIKIKEPENFKSKKPKNKNLDSKGKDLSHYFSSPSIKNNSAVDKSMDKTAPTSRLNNVVGFNDLLSGNDSPKSSGSFVSNPKRFGGMGMMSNRGGTVIMKPKNVTVSSKDVKVNGKLMNYLPSIKNSTADASNIQVKSLNVSVKSTNSGSYYYPSKVNNVVGFKDLNEAPGENSKTNFASGSKGMVAFSGTGHTLGSGNRNDGSKSLLNQFSPSGSNNQSTRNLPVIKTESERRNVSEVEVENIIVLDSDDECEPNHVAHCPVCNESVETKDMNEHLDGCVNLDSIFDMTNIKLESDDEDEMESTEEPQEWDEMEVIEEPEESGSILCPCCNAKCTPQNINEHLDACLAS